MALSHACSLYSKKGKEEGSGRCSCTYLSACRGYGVLWAPASDSLLLCDPHTATQDLTPVLLTLSLVPKVWAHPFASRYEKVPLRDLMDGHRPPQPIKLTGQQISPQQLCYRIRLGTFNALFKPREGSSPKLQCIAFSIRSAASFKEWECFRPTYY